METQETSSEETQVTENPSTTVESGSFSTETNELMQTKGWSTPDDMAKSYSELEKFVGNRDSIIKLPTEPDSEEWGDIYNKLGRPETPDKYDFKNDSGIELDENSMAAFKETAHKAGLTQAQYEIAVKEHINVFKNLAEKGENLKKEEDAKYEAELKACDEALAKDWGEERNANTVKALEFAKEFKLLELLEKKKLDSDPEIIRALYDLNKLRGEDGIKTSSVTQKLSREEELKAIADNPAWNDNMHPDHEKVHAKYLELMGIGG